MDLQRREFQHDRGKRRWCHNLATIGPPIPSNPYFIPNSVFSDETPGSGNDEVVLSVIQCNKASFPGCATTSYTMVGNQGIIFY